MKKFDLSNAPSRLCALGTSLNRMAYAIFLSLLNDVSWWKQHWRGEAALWEADAISQRATGLLRLAHCLCLILIVRASPPLPCHPPFLGPYHPPFRKSNRKSEREREKLGQRREYKPSSANLLFLVYILLNPASLLTASSKRIKHDPFLALIFFFFSDVHAKGK